MHIAVVNMMYRMIPTQTSFILQIAEEVNVISIRRMGERNIVDRKFHYIEMMLFCGCVFVRLWCGLCVYVTECVCVFVYVSEC